MAVCPLYLTNVLNGVYYYYCQSCDNPSQFVSGNDTMAHQTGINCQPAGNCRQPISYSAKAWGRKLGHTPGDNCKKYGLDSIGYLKSPYDIDLSPLTRIKNRFIAEYPEDFKIGDVPYKRRLVCLFQLEVAGHEFKSEELFIGHEIKPESATPAIKCKKISEEDHYHLIQEDLSGEDYHILVKKK